MPARKKAPTAAQAARKAVSLTPEDAHNLIVLLDRVTVQGVQEAMLLGVLANKLSVIKGEFKAPNGKDSTPAN